MHMSTIFKKIIDKEILASIVYEDDVVLAFLDIYPIRKGHTLIIPKKESVNIYDTDADTLAHMMVVAQKVAVGITETFHAPAVNIHMNNGAEAGQDIFHIHLHVIPRYERGEAFVVPKHESYDEGEEREYAEKLKTAIA